MTDSSSWPSKRASTAVNASAVRRDTTYVNAILGHGAEQSGTRKAAKKVEEA
jgi:hypothetical protein